jgi:hypothetical protein
MIYVTEAGISEKDFTPIFAAGTITNYLTV